MSAAPPTFEDVKAAAARLASRVHRTPVATCSALDERAGRRLYFKCEHQQKVGAFKFRGASNAVLQLDEEAAARGVVTHSSGNHAQALALAARQRGIPAFVVMPENAPRVKRSAVEGYGAEVHPCAATLEARERRAAEIVERTGATFIHPYDDPRIVAGQGTATLELLEEVPDLDAVVAPVGGGGLLAGACIAAHGVRPEIRVFGAEPAGADDAARSVAAGRLVPQTGPTTIADGLLTSLGQVTWPIIRDHVAAILLVSEEEIVAALRLAWERAKLLIEPSAAVAVAAALNPDERAFAGLERVGVILSGGNLDLGRAAEWFAPPT